MMMTMTLMMTGMKTWTVSSKSSKSHSILLKEFLSSVVAHSCSSPRLTMIMIMTMMMMIMMMMMMMMIMMMKTKKNIETLVEVEDGETAPACSRLQLLPIFRRVLESS